MCIFSNFSATSKAWYPEEGIRGSVSKRNSRRRYKSIIPRYPWCIVTGSGLWQVGGPISNSSSCLRDIYAHTNCLESMISWICIYVYTHARRENKREGKVGSTKSRPRQIGNRSLDSIWNATNPADRVYDNVKRWNDLVSFVVSLTREWYTALDENTTGEARNKLQGTNRGGPLGFSYRPINNWQRMAFCHLVYSIN